MKVSQVNSELGKARALRWFEYVLLVVCLCVLAFRAMYIESPHVVVVSSKQVLGSDAFSLIASSVLILSAIGWVVFAFCYRKISYRFSGIEVGIVIFFIAGIVGIFVAANKRAAITDLATLIGPMLMALLLVQILDSQSKIKLVLFVIVALGAASSYQCADQLLKGKQDMINSYEQNPQQHLAALGITPGSFEQMLYEHRLYSKDIRGFLTTSNSAGSFAILAVFAAIGLFIEKIKSHSRKSSYAGLVYFGIIAAAVAAGLIITQSKGAIVAAALCGLMLAAFLGFGKWLWDHRKTVLVFCLLLVFVGMAAVIWYGVSHGRLPGGNSMLMRWQYWQGAAKMYAHRPMTGVGGGNFASYYPHYKIASAPETVRDPHNFILSLLSQYGPLGLIGFLAAFLVALYRTIFVATAQDSQKLQANNKAFGALAGVALFFISVVLLTFRPIAMPIEADGLINEKICAAIVLFIFPVVVFMLAFLLLWVGERTTAPATRTLGSAARAAIFCGIVAVAIHNVIDFAIFEPAVLTTFWATVACLVAISYKGKGHRTATLRPSQTMRIATVATGAIIAWLCCHYALIPVAKASLNTHRATRQLGHAHELLDQAAKDDRLSPAALYFNGRLYLQQYNETEKKQPALLEQAVECFAGAIERGKANFKSYAKLSTAYNLLAETSTQQAKTDWLNKAFRSSLLAVERYPGSGRLRVKLAKIAEQLGKTDIAIEQYKKAIDIEDAYRSQFQLMYPGRQLFSRLGEEKYQSAKQRVKHLCP